MFCKKCDLEVHGGAQGICPICNGPLDDTPALVHSESGNLKDEQKLQDLISNIDATVKQSLETTDAAGGGAVPSLDFMMKAMHKAKADDTVIEGPETQEEEEAPFDLEKALATEGAPLPNRASGAAGSGDEQVGDFSRTKDILAKTLEEFAPPPVPQEAVNHNPKSGALFKVLIVFLVVIIGGAAGYYFSFKEPEPVKRAIALPKKIAPVTVQKTEVDKKNQGTRPNVQMQKAADEKQTDPGKKAASQPMAEPAHIPASQTAPPPARKEETPAATVIENKPAEPIRVVAPVEKKPAQPPAEEKKDVAPPPLETAAPAIYYFVNVGSYKLKESADTVIKDLKKKGYEPAVDTVTVKDITWYRVTLGHFQTQGEAQNYARELQSKENIKGFVGKKK